MVLDSHEDEELEKLKQWWKENGTAVILGISLGLIAIFGWRGWQVYQQKQNEAASHLYQQAFNQFHQGQPVEARAAADRLLMEYSNSTYAALASLLLAAQQAAADQQPEAALAHLDWVIANAKLPALKELAQLRKARMLVAQGQADKALEIIDSPVSAAFKTAYLVLKGDILSQRGDAAQAREIYQQARQAESLSGQMRQWLDLKLDDLGATEAAVIAQLSEADKTLRDTLPPAEAQAPAITDMPPGAVSVEEGLAPISEESPATAAPATDEPAAAPETAPQPAPANP